MADGSTTIDAGGRELRVTSADRVIFPATEQTAAVTKLDVVRYYLAVGDGILRALWRRPTTLERWPKGVHPGIVLTTREGRGGEEEDGGASGHGGVRRGTRGRRRSPARSGTRTCSGSRRPATRRSR